MISDSIIDVDLNAVIKRLEKELETKSDRALSAKLGLSTSGIAMSRKKNMLPYTAIVTTCIKHGISTDRIFGITGTADTQSNATEEREVKQQPGLTTADLLAASNMVEEVLAQVLATKNFELAREVFVCKQLRPVLLKAALKNYLNRTVIQGIAEGVVSITK
jgi:hypothetical protein